MALCYSRINLYWAGQATGKKNKKKTPMWTQMISLSLSEQDHPSIAEQNQLIWWVSMNPKPLHPLGPYIDALDWLFSY